MQAIEKDVLSFNCAFRSKDAIIALRWISALLLQDCKKTYMVQRALREDLDSIEVAC